MGREGKLRKDRRSRIARRLRRSEGKAAFGFSLASVALLSTIRQKWQSTIWAAKMTEIQFEQNVVGLAQVGRIAAVFPNLRKVETCASWQIYGTFLRKLGREAQKTGVCADCRFGKIGCDLRKLAKNADICPISMRKLGKAGRIREVPARGRHRQNRGAAWPGGAWRYNRHSPTSSVPSVRQRAG